MPVGGFRIGAGRKKGSHSLKTIEKKLVEEELKRRVLGNAQNLLNSQLSLARGCSFLYRIIKNEKGVKSKPELITDEKIIQKYLDNTLKNSDNEYFYITIDKPDGRAIDSLFDRTFGRPVETMKIEEDVKLKIDV